MWPAALALWGIPETDPRRFLWEEAFWQDNELILSGLPPLSQAAIAAKAHEQKGITGAIGHAYSRWAWGRQPSRSATVTTGRPRSMRLPCAAATAPSPSSTAVGRLSADDLQPDRHLVRRRLRDGRRGSRSTRNAGRSASPRPTTSSSAARRSPGRSSAAWPRVDSRWAWATRSSNTCRPSRTVQATASGTSASISSPAPRICRCTGSKQRYCRPCRPRSRPREWPSSETRSSMGNDHFDQRLNLLPGPLWFFVVPEEPYCASPACFIAFRQH